MFLGICPPTPFKPNINTYFLFWRKVLGLGRGRRAVSQKHTLIQIWLEVLKNLKEAQRSQER